jgi:outer membrane biosynthesis protein TonB
LLHGAIGAAIWTSTVLAPAPQFFDTLAIDISSPPPTVEAEEMQPGTPEEQLVVEAPAPPEPEPPAPEPPAPEPERPAPPRPEPPRETQPNRPSNPTPPNPDSARRNEPSAGPGAVASSPGGENINVRMEGLRRDYPEYYNNIVIQIKRCFRPTNPNQRLTAVVAFAIMRDGSVSEVQLARRSASAAFNVDAMSAVECAGRPGRLGPLPADLPFDRLPVQFEFSPGGPGGPGELTWRLE